MPVNQQSKAINPENEPIPTEQAKIDYYKACQIAASMKFNPDDIKL